MGVSESRRAAELMLIPSETAKHLGLFVTLRDETAILKKKKNHVETRFESLQSTLKPAEFLVDYLKACFKCVNVYALK